MPPIVYLIVAAIVVLFGTFLAGYLKAPPDTAYIISGLGKSVF